MKISRILKDKKIEKAVADLRPKLLIAFIITMIAVVLFWVFRFACITKVGFWFTLWNLLYHLGRLVAVVLLISIALAWIYLLIYSGKEAFGKNGSVYTFRAKKASPKAKSSEPGDYNWTINTGDLSDFE